MSSQPQTPDDILQVERKIIMRMPHLQLGARDKLIDWYGDELFDEHDDSLRLLYIYNGQDITIAAIKRFNPEEVDSIEIARVFRIEDSWEISIDQIINVVSDLL